MGISHYTTPPHTPEQNGIAERRHRHVVETVLALLHYAHLPLTFWSHAFQTAVYLINRLPTHTLNNQTPFHRLFQQTPNYTKLKPFGCLCYPWLRPYTTSKLQPRSIPCIFLGYSTAKSAYKCFDPQTNRLYHSRHVQFIESTFPSASQNSSPLPTPSQFRNPSTSTPYLFLTFCNPSSNFVPSSLITIRYTTNPQPACIQPEYPSHSHRTSCNYPTQSSSSHLGIHYYQPHSKLRPSPSSKPKTQPQILQQLIHKHHYPSSHTTNN